MEPIDFKQSNMKLTAPGSIPDCGDLPVYTDGKQCISCWKLSIKERIKILFTGRVWLDVIGHRTQPPVWVDVKKPFIEPNFFDHIRFAFYWLKDLFRNVAKMIISVPKAVKNQPDKRKHAFAGGSIAILAFTPVMVLLSGKNPDGLVMLWSSVAGMLASSIAGISKEVYDRVSGKGTPETMDVFATMFGGSVGVAIYLIAMLIVMLFVVVF